MGSFIVVPGRLAARHPPSLGGRDVWIRPPDSGVCGSVDPEHDRYGRWNSAEAPDLTVTEPGRYLVICAIRSHFLDDGPGANGGLFGFIDVR